MSQFHFGSIQTAPSGCQPLLSVWSLNSTLVQFKQDWILPRSLTQKGPSQFHFGSIQTDGVTVVLSDGREMSQFHFGSIQTGKWPNGKGSIMIPSQFHFGSIQTTKSSPLRERTCLVVSIPLWFNSNGATGSSESVVSWGVSIPLWFNSNRSDGQ